MGRRSKVAGLTGVGARRRRLARRGSGRRSEHAQKVTEVGFAAPEKPTDYGWNQQGLVGAKKAAEGNRGQGDRRDRLGLRQRRAESPATRAAGR